MFIVYCLMSAFSVVYIERLVPLLLLNVCPAGAQDADRGGDHLRAAVAAPPRPPRLQHRGLPQPDPPADGPLVPYVRQDMHLHQQVSQCFAFIFMSKYIFR